MLDVEGLTTVVGKSFAQIPETHGAWAVLGPEGDTKVIWDPSNAVEVDIARESFKKFVKNGYLAFAVTGDNGDKGDQIREFDPKLRRVIFTPPMAAG